MPDKAFLCLCLDITSADVDRAIAEGFTDAETLKRYTACFMGPCQGKACMDSVLAYVAERTGVDPAELRRRVTSPGGLTERGTAVLEAAGLREAFDGAVGAAVGE